MVGALSTARGAAASHDGHGDGLSKSAIGRKAVNGPQVAQR
jgi:hypothetical protein